MLFYSFVPKSKRQVTKDNKNNNNNKSIIVIKSSKFKAIRLSKREYKIV